MPSPKKAHELAELETAFLECRDFGHAWTWTSDRHIVFGPRKKPIEFIRVLICTRCEMTRSQTIDLKTWSPVKGNKYGNVPDFYYMEKTDDGGRHRRSDFRQELIQRIINVNTGRKRAGS